MAAIDSLVDDFLAQKRIAVAGVSGKKNTVANVIYSKLKRAGYQVYPVNPNSETIDDDTCYPDLSSLPEPVDGVVIATRPAITEQIVRKCVEHGVSRVWMHCSLGTHPRGSIRIGRAITSVSKEAVKICRENNIKVIPGACPMMFCEPVDIPHKMMRAVLRVLGGFKNWE